MVDTRNLSVMFTDIKGFTARASRSSREDLVSLLKTHEELVIPRAERRGGTLIKTIGDAFLFTFESPTNAVLAAIEVQTALREHNTNRPEEERIEIRMGINAGEVTVIDGDVFGDAVNIASRIESIALPNEVFFSETVFLTLNRRELEEALVRQGWATSEIGYKSLKGVEERVRLFRCHDPARARSGLEELELLGPATDVLGPGLHVESVAERQRRLTGEQAVVPLRELDLDDGRAAPALAQRRGVSGEHPTVVLPGRGSRKVTAPAPRGRARAGRIVGRSLMGIAVAGALVVVLAGAALQSAWVLGMGALAAVAFAPVNVGFAYGKTLMARLLALAGILVGIGVLGGMAKREIAARVEVIEVRLQGAAPQALSLVDRMAVYALHLGSVLDHAMSGSLEAARQQVLMCLSGSPIRGRRSAAPMALPEVTTRLGEVAASLRVEWGRGTAEVDVPAARVVARDDAAPAPLRAAMRSMRLGAHATRAPTPEGRYELEVTASVPVTYRPGEARAILSFGGAPVSFPERLGWALQEVGWLFPYEERWTWRVPSDDPRLPVGPSVTRADAP